MKKDVFRWLRRCQLPLLLLLSVVPVMLVSLCLHAPDALGALGVLCVAYTAIAALCLAVPGSRRMLTAALSSFALLALSARLLPLVSRPLLALLPAALIGLLFFSLPLAARRYESDVPPYVYFVGVAVHVVVQFLHRYFASYDGISPFAPVSSALTASLIGYMLLFLLSMNRISLDNASLARHRIPAGMRAVNTAMTLLFVCASLLLAVTPAIVRGATALWRALLSAIRQLAALLLSFLPAAPDTGSGVPAEVDGVYLASEGIEQAGPLAILFQKIISVFAMIFLVAGSLFLLYTVARLLLRLARRMLARLRTYMSAASDEYDDEITDTREDGAQREIRFLRSIRRPPAETENTPAGRIRRSYARMMRRRPQWSASSTARENLPASAAELYERARYSEHPVTDEDADRFSAEIRKA